MIFLFEIYSWLTHIGYALLDLLPVIIRRIILKMILGKWGSDGMIDRKVYFRYPSKISIGRKCYINRGCRFFCSAHTKDRVNILIGDNVVIGPYVTVFSAGHDPNTLNLTDTYGRVTIEKNVWIGGNTTILQGVTIHEGAVIGAGSVVTKDVPAWTVNVGVPAKTIKNRKINKE